MGIAIKKITLAAILENGDDQIMFYSVFFSNKKIEDEAPLLNIFETLVDSNLSIAETLFGTP